jgi:hypothetical protein
MSKFYLLFYGHLINNALEYEQSRNGFLEEHDWFIVMKYRHIELLLALRGRRSSDQRL